jgi:hypothetical protein
VLWLGGLKFRCESYQFWCASGCFWGGSRRSVEYFQGHMRPGYQPCRRIFSKARHTQGYRWRWKGSQNASLTKVASLQFAVESLWSDRETLICRRDCEGIYGSDTSIQISLRTRHQYQRLLGRTTYMRSDLYCLRLDYGLASSGFPSQLNKCVIRRFLISTLPRLSRKLIVNLYSARNVYLTIN